MRNSPLPSAKLGDVLLAVLGAAITKIMELRFNEPYQLR